MIMFGRLVAVVLGFLLIGFLWWLALRRFRTIRDALITEATIIEMIPVETLMEPGGVSYVPKLRFRAHDGTEHIVTRIYSSPGSWRTKRCVGQRVRIAYDPRTYNAEILRSNTNLLIWLSLFTAAILGILWVLLVD
jgi:hypothetical protein